MCTDAAYKKRIQTKKTEVHSDHKISKFEILSDLERQELDLVSAHITCAMTLTP